MFSFSSMGYMCILYMLYIGNAADQGAEQACQHRDRGRQEAHA